MFKCTFLILTLTFHNSIAIDYLLSKAAIKQLDAWELKILRDFVRGRGRPIVERIPLDTLEEDREVEFGNESELIDLMDPMAIPQGGLAKNAEEKPISVQGPLVPPQPITQIITPASKKRKTSKKPKKEQTSKEFAPRENDKPSVQDYQHLASMIQMFIDRRSHKDKVSKTKHPNKIEPTTVGAPRKITTSAPVQKKLPSDIITSSNGKQNVVFDLGQTSSLNEWTPMEYDLESPKKLENKKKTSYDQRMKELSTELTKILKQLEDSKAERQPKIVVLRNGSAEQTSDGQYIFIATITLIKDGDNNILVDTGLGTNINARTELLQELEKQGLTPADIQIVVSTHGHPDHNGGLHDFPDAIHYHSWYSHSQTKFNLTELFENETMNLSENVMLVKSKGHTSDDIAVVVRDAKGRGDVLVAGDLFMRSEDIDHPMMWQPLSADVISQRDSRRRFGCIVDWIVPGHGAMFRVTSDVKKSLKC